MDYYGHSFNPYFRSGRLGTGPAKEFRSYLNARKIDLWLDCDAQPVLSLSGRIYSELMEKRVWSNQREPDKRLRHLRMLLLNLYAAAAVDENRYVSISMDNNDYSIVTRYEPEFRSYKILSKLLNGLGPGSLGYIDQKTGWLDRGADKGYWTRIRATSPLQDLFSEFGLHPWMISKTSDAEVIRLKDSDKKRQEYRDDENSDRMRANLRRLNRNISKTFIGLHVSDIELNNVFSNATTSASFGDYEEDPKIDFGDCWLYRVFNDSCFNRGGRFYGGWWQYIRSEYRPHIYVCAAGSRRLQYTIELDYSSVQPSIAYAQRGIEPPTDAYKLDGYSVSESERSRKVLKAALLRMFNTDSISAAVRSTLNYVQQEGLKFSEGDVSQLVDALKKQHPDIADMFFDKETGKKLMKQESDIAEWVMLDMLDKAAVTLPVHDSFLVDRESAEELEESMNAAFQNRFDVNCKIKADMTELEKEGWDPADPRFQFLEYEDYLDDEETHSRFWDNFMSWLDNQENRRKI